VPPHATAARARPAIRRETAARTPRPHPPRVHAPPPATAKPPAARNGRHPPRVHAPPRNRQPPATAAIRRASTRPRESAARPQRPNPPHDASPPYSDARGISRTPATSRAVMHGRAKHSAVVRLPSREERAQHSPAPNPATIRTPSAHAKQSPAANPARKPHDMPPPLSNRRQHPHAHPRFAPSSKPRTSRPRSSRKPPTSSIHRQFAALSTFVPLLNPCPALFVAPPRPKLFPCSIPALPCSLPRLARNEGQRRRSLPRHRIGTISAIAQPRRARPRYDPLSNMFVYTQFATTNDFNCRPFIVLGLCRHGKTHFTNAIR
jgi:hypothetical protein